MHKDLDLGKSGDWCKHTRNSANGKAGINRVKRRRVKSNTPPIDAAAAPKRPKQKKKWGIKTGSFYNWYITEKARDDAWDALVKANRLHEQQIGSHWWAKLKIKTIKKVER